MKTELMYKLVLTGRVRTDYSKEEVKDSLTRLLKRDADEVERIWASAPVVVKTQLPESQVQRYLETFGKTGAIFDAVVDFVPLDGFTEPDPEPVAAPPAAAPEPAKPSYAEAAAASAARLAEAAEEIRCPKCQLVQPKRTLCRDCGVNIPQYLAAQALPQPRVAAPPAAPPEVFLRIPQHDYDGRMAKLFDVWFDGRIGRIRFLAWNVPAVVAILLVGTIAEMLRHTSIVATVALLFVAVIAVSYFMVRVAALRFHDFGKSGWYGLLILVPIVNVAVALALMGVPGTKDDNAYGDLPKRNNPPVYVFAAGLIAVAAVTAIFR